MFVPKPKSLEHRRRISEAKTGRPGWKPTEEQRQAKSKTCLDRGITLSRAAIMKSAGLRKGSKWMSCKETQKSKMIRASEIQQHQENGWKIGRSY
jgi:hypothetical protein